MRNNRTVLPMGHILIDGQWVGSSSGQTFENIDPSNRKKLGVVAQGQAIDVDQAVKAAQIAFDGPWSSISGPERSRMLLRLSGLIREHREELAVLESQDVGRPISQSRAAMESVAHHWEFYSGIADKIFGTTIPVGPGFFSYTVKEPLGVCAAIIAWNGPLQLASRDMAPALAAGNTCVLKPAEQAPLSPLRLGELALEAGIPPGVINIVPGFGEEAGASLASHPGIDHLAFTGSVETGTKIMQMAATHITPVLLELGGKSPNIICRDADIDRSVQTIVNSVAQNSGQNCAGGYRILVESSIQSEVVSKLKDRMSRLSLGPGLEDPDIGPLISEDQQNRVLNYMKIGKEEGAVIAMGGGLPKSPKLARGFFVEPTIFDHVDPRMRIAQEEIFGPVLSVIPFTNIDQALEIANGTFYGLAAGIWTKDLQKAHWFAEHIKAGSVSINTYGVPNPVALPSGGYKRSGFGRVRGVEALNSYTQLKTVAIYTG